MWLFLLFQVDTCMISGIFVAFAENSLCKIKINGDNVLVPAPPPPRSKNIDVWFH